MAKEKLIPIRNGFGKGLLSLGKSNKDVIALTADLKDSTKIEDFAKKYPTRFIELGVAEQNLASVSAGMALNGKIPFMCSYGVFNPGRNWEVIRTLIAINNLNVKIIGSHGGVVTGEDGATHQALEDIALARVLPNMTVISPCDSIEAKKATIAAAKTKGPVYIRLARPATPIITTKNTRFEIGKANIVNKGKHVTIVATGHMVSEALKAVKELKKKKISIELINLSTVKPLDEKTILKSIKKTNKLVTIEDHQKSAGMSSAVVEMLSQKYPVKTIVMGVDDSFGQSGKPEELLKYYHLTYKDIIDNVNKIYRK